MRVELEEEWKIHNLHIVGIMIMDIQGGRTDINILQKKESEH